MANHMQQSIKSCACCLQHEGNLSKALLHPIVATTPMDLLHMDFTSIPMTLEQNRLPKAVNILVFQDHFMKQVMAYVTPNQMAKTVAMFLYQGYILIFGALARLLSDWGVNFTSSIIDEMCKLLSIKKLWTTLYHPQMNGLVERSHQAIMQMIGKLGQDKKANWPGHLAEIVHAYNATWSTVMRYSPHYLMFGCRPRLLINFYFPTFRSAEVPQERCLCQVCGQICGYCPWAIEGCPPGSSGPVNGRSPKTETVLWPKDRCHESEAWWSGLSEGWCLSGKEED